MKNSILLLATIALLSIGIYAFTRMVSKQHGTSIRVSETKGSYRYNASFSPSISNAIHDYLDSEFADITPFKGSDSFKGKLSLGDTASYSLTAEPGYINFALEKISNTPAAYAKAKQIGDRISLIIASGR